MDRGGLGKAFRENEKTLPQTFRLKFLDERSERHRTQVFTGACTHGNEPIFLLAVADYKKKRDFLQRMFAYFIANFLVAQIRFHPESLFYKGFRHFGGIFGLRIGDI